MKLIIFDMDGVLIDACDWHRISFNEALKKYYNYEISLDDHYNNFNGLPTKVKLKKLEERGDITNIFFDEVEKIKQQKTIEIINKYACLDKEKIDLMNFLKSKNLKIACYTNSIKNTAELMLKKVGVFNFLDLLITNQDVKNSKPDPEGYLLILEKMQISKKDCLIIEDSPKGIEAAKMSGCEYLKVNNSTEVTIDLFKDII